MDIMNLVQRSFYGGVLILVILALRALLLGRLPKKTFPVLWTVVLLRLLIPFSFSSGLSIYSLLPFGQMHDRLESSVPGMPQRMVPGQNGISEQEAASAQSMLAGQNIMPEQGTVSEPNVTSGQIRMPGDSPFRAAFAALLSGENMTRISEAGHFSPLFLLWCIGAVLCAAWFGAAYLRGIWGFRKSVPARDPWIRQWLRQHKLRHFIRVRMSDRISAPLTYGCLRPVILLPEHLTGESRQELEYVLQHEYVHIRRCDAARKLAMMAALCIHWFNPLVWLMSGLLSRDIELACDEGVLQQSGEQSRAEYAMALIGMEEKKRSLLPLYNGFSKNSIEERITLIMKYRKITYMTSISSLLLILCVALLFATSAKGAENRENPDDTLKNEMEKTPENALADSPEDSLSSNTDIPEENIPDNISEQPADEEENREQTGSPYILSYLSEGLPTEVEAELYMGERYCILIPKEGWKSYAPDAWAWETNEQIQVWVNDCSGSTWDQTVRHLEELGYTQTETEGLWEKESESRLLFAEIKKSGFQIMCVNYSYPADSEYIEGAGTEVRAVVASFTPISDESEADLSKDGNQIKQLALAFWEAYLAGNSEAITAYLAEDYMWDIELFPDGRDGHVASEARVQALKGIDMDTIGENITPGETFEIHVEFRPAAGADYLEYLTIEVIKESDDWKVQFYGLEM